MGRRAGGGVQKCKINLKKTNYKRWRVFYLPLEAVIQKRRRWDRI